MKKIIEKAFGESRSRAKHSELLSAFHDGELGTSDEKLVTKLLSSESTRAELESFRELRGQLRQWNSETQAEIKKIDVWSKISVQINAEAERLQRPSWYQGLLDAIRIRPEYQMAVATAFVGVFALSFMVNGSSTSDSPQSVSPGRNAPNYVLVSPRPGSPALIMEDDVARSFRNRLQNYAANDQRGSGTASRESAPRDSVMRSSVTDDLVTTVSNSAVPTSRGFESVRGLPMRMASSRMFRPDFVLGGLRTDGVDIDWIQSKQSVDILPSHNRSQPPVIWVARR